MKNLVICCLLTLASLSNAGSILTFDVARENGEYVIIRAGAVPGNVFHLDKESFLNKPVKVGFKPFGQENLDKTMRCIEIMFKNEEPEPCSVLYSLVNPKTSAVENFEANFTMPKLHEEASPEISILISTR